MNGSADRLPFSDRSFDCITSAFALRNLRGCLEAALKENFRVLRNGGKVLHMDFGRPDSALSRFGHQVHFASGFRLSGNGSAVSAGRKDISRTPSGSFMSPAKWWSSWSAPVFRMCNISPLAFGAVQIYEGIKPC